MNAKTAVGISRQQILAVAAAGAIAAARTLTADAYRYSY
jgi:hypothetical protein